MQPTSNPESPHLRIPHWRLAHGLPIRCGPAVDRTGGTPRKCPGVAGMANISVDRVSNMFSDDMRPVHWNRMAEASRTAFEDGQAL